MHNHDTPIYGLLPRNPKEPYLSTISGGGYFGSALISMLGWRKKININEASIEELQELDGITEDDAKKIVEERRSRRQSELIKILGEDYNDASYKEINIIYETSCEDLQKQYGIPENDAKRILENKGFKKKQEIEKIIDRNSFENIKNSICTENQFHFNTQWDRFPFNPEKKIVSIPESIKVDKPYLPNSKKYVAKDYNGDLEVGRNKLLRYLVEKGNFLTPQKSFFSRDMVRMVGGFIGGMGITLLMYLVFVITVALSHLAIVSSIPDVQSAFANPLCLVSTEKPAEGGKTALELCNELNLNRKEQDPLLGDLQFIDKRDIWDFSFWNKAKNTQELSLSHKEETSLDLKTTITLTEADKNAFLLEGSSSLSTTTADSSIPALAWIRNSPLKPHNHLFSLIYGSLFGAFVGLGIIVSNQPFYSIYKEYAPHIKRLNGLQLFTYILIWILSLWTFKYLLPIYNIPHEKLPLIMIITTTLVFALYNHLLRKTSTRNTSYSLDPNTIYDRLLLSTFSLFFLWFTVLAYQEIRTAEAVYTSGFFWIFHPLTTSIGCLIGLFVARAVLTIPPLFPIIKYVLHLLSNLSYNIKEWSSKKIKESRVTTQALKTFSVSESSISTWKGFNKPNQNPDSGKQTPWSIPQIRSSWNSWKGINIYALLLFAIFGLLIIPQLFVTPASNKAKEIIPLSSALISSTWAGIMIYLKSSAASNSQGKTKIFELPEGVWQGLLSALVFILNISILFIIETQIIKLLRNPNFQSLGLSLWVLALIFMGLLVIITWTICSASGENGIFGIKNKTLS